MATNIENREKIVSFLRQELVGPWPNGDEIDCTGQIEFPAEEYKKLYQPWRQKESGEEILIGEGSPTLRYGVGVLYPANQSAGGIPAEDELIFNSVEQGVSSESGQIQVEISKDAEKALKKISDRTGAGSADEKQSGDELGISSANELKPACMGLTFCTALSENSQFFVSFDSGRYVAITARAGEREAQWWMRKPLPKADFTFELSNQEIASLTSPPHRLTIERKIRVRDEKFIHVTFELLAREQKDGSYLITITVVNRSSATNLDNEQCLFQCSLSVSVFDKASLKPLIKPYPESIERSIEEDQEVASLDLLYRSARSFAIGHGASADWDTHDTDGEAAETASSVSAVPLPIVETPNITPEILRNDGSLVQVPMQPLAGVRDPSEGFEAINEVMRLYEEWVKKAREEAKSLKITHQIAAAKRHLDICEVALDRMRAGLHFVQNDPTAKSAFALANRAILLQQLRYSNQARTVEYNRAEARLVFGGTQADRDVLTGAPDRNWRPFQIAFMLLAAESVANGESPERDIVDLIWFPTGGGKTEAYLGLSAFSIFYRRLKNKADTGTDVIMRYTLRLLTAQQFQRCAALICAMDFIRSENTEQLGEDPIRIGIWLGSSMSPNSRAQALSALRALKKSGAKDENPFIISRCPWCSAPMGVPNYEGIGSKEAPRVLGYKTTKHSMAYHCPDNRCHFHKQLPVVTVDEDIYDSPPEIVIGTVDKFAQIVWQPKTRALFGIDVDGTRFTSPPNLIIQDELHLISGPLGSMVGMYETLIEDLCTNKGPGGSAGVPPKIITSTATIRRYERQVKDLYARNRTSLFPPPGINADDSFFSRYAKTAEGGLLPGRIFVGVHGAGLASMQTAQVRTFTALCQAPMQFEKDEEKDPWWTLLVFFNSIRELSTTVSLFQQDIPARLEILRSRTGEPKRYTNNVRELTSRLQNHEVPEAIDLLSKPINMTKYPVDVCLASSIIEVGVDIDRLAMMCVVGQPKTTSQYIQVTGRVGRDWKNKPGLVVTLFSPSKPRDRSHFEKFRTYHERLYAQVEPTSVTPFAPPVVERALHAVIAGYVRQNGSVEESLSPDPVPERLVNEVRDLVIDRVNEVDPEELVNTKLFFEKRLKQWRRWGKLFWDQRSQEEGSDFPLLRMAGQYADPAFKARSWSTPNSMRNVDAECQAEITTLYTPTDEDLDDA